MTFNSVTYFTFFAVVLVLYWGLRRRRPQNVLLVVASYVFYGSWDWRFLGLLAFSTALDYVVGLAIAASDDLRVRRRWLAGSVILNLGLLATFKYFGFFVDSFETFSAALGLGLSGPLLEVILPVGISFYTFQSMSYAIDVYRGACEPCRDPVAYAAYVAFFPQLVAGPIERAAHLLPQFRRERTPPTAEQVGSGCTLILTGLFKKIAIADAVAPVANAAFAGSGDVSAPAAIIGVWAFALQIYGDFSGYTDIARGSARLLGIELMVNFREPYLSRDVTEFWRRWHISLSTWLRDYLYIPLGGNQRGPRRTYLNLMIVMLLGGLWHGAAWTFVAWGALNGFYLAAERMRADRRARLHPDLPPPLEPTGAGSVLKIVATFQLICVTWVFFRSESFAQAGEMFTAILTRWPGSVEPGSLALLAWAVAATGALDLLARRRVEDAPVATLAPARRGLAVAAMLVPIVVFSGATPIPFIYFQF